MESGSSAFKARALAHRVISAQTQVNLEAGSELHANPEDKSAGSGVTGDDSFGNRLLPKCQSLNWDPQHQVEAGCSYVDQQCGKVLVALSRGTHILRPLECERSLRAWPLPLVLVGAGDAFERRGWGREHTHQESDGSSIGLHWGSPRKRHVWVCL